MEQQLQQEQQPHDPAGGYGHAQYSSSRPSLLRRVVKSCHTTTIHTKTTIRTRRNVVLCVLVMFQLYLIFLSFSLETAGPRQDDSTTKPSFASHYYGAAPQRPDEPEMLVSYYWKQKNDPRQPPPIVPPQRLVESTTNASTTATTSPKEWLMRHNTTTSTTATITPPSFTKTSSPPLPPPPPQDDVPKFSISEKSLSLQFLQQQHQRFTTKEEEDDDDDDQQQQAIQKLDTRLEDLDLQAEIQPHNDQQQQAVNNKFDTRLEDLLDLQTEIQQHNDHQQQAVNQKLDTTVENLLDLQAEIQQHDDQQRQAANQKLDTRLECLLDLQAEIQPHDDRQQQTNQKLDTILEGVLDLQAEIQPHDDQQQQAKQKLDTILEDLDLQADIQQQQPQQPRIENPPQDDYRMCVVNQPFPRPPDACVVHPQTMIPYCHFGGGAGAGAGSSSFSSGGGEWLQIHLSRIHVSSGNESVQTVWGRLEAEEFPRYSGGAFELVVGDEEERRRRGHRSTRAVLPVPYYYNSSAQRQGHDDPTMVDYTNHHQNNHGSMREHFFYINDVLNSMSTAENRTEKGGDENATTTLDDPLPFHTNFSTTTSALTRRTAQQQHQCTHTLPGRVFLITRYEYCNLFHTVTDWFNTFLAVAPPPPPPPPPPPLPNVPPASSRIATLEKGHSQVSSKNQPQFRNHDEKSVSILFLDGHARGALDDVWSTVFGKTYFIKSSFATTTQHKEDGKNDSTTTKDNNQNTAGAGASSPVVCLRDATLVPPGYDSVLWPRNRNFPDQMPVCPSMMQAFVDHVLHAYQLQHVSMIPGKITIIDRRPYRAHPRSSWHNNNSSSQDQNHRRERRVLDNLPELVQALKQQQRLTGNISLSIQVAALETMSFREQLQLIRETHVLIGNHGAGLTHLLFLHDSAMVLEYQRGPSSIPSFRTW